MFHKTFKTFFGVIENSPSATCRLVAQPQPLLLPSYPWLASLDGKMLRSGGSWLKKENRSQLIKLLVEIFREIFSWDFEGFARPEEKES